MLAVAVANLLRFLLDVEGVPGTFAGDQLDRLAAIVVHRVDGGGGVEGASRVVELFEERAALSDARLGQAARKVEQLGLAHLAGIDADIRVDR